MMPLPQDPSVFPNGDPTPLLMTLCTDAGGTDNTQGETCKAAKLLIPTIVSNRLVSRLE